MKYNATITEIVDITPDIKIFQITPDFGKLDFKAGQFAVLGLPDDPDNPDGEWHRRAYSIASAPDKPTVGFYIVLVSDAAPPAPPAKLTPRMWKLKEGDKIFLGEKVAGHMLLPDDLGVKNLLFIATGTGIAPFASMLMDRNEEIFGGKHKVCIVQGARHSCELGFKGFFINREKKSPDTFFYYPVVSRPKESEQWTGFTGRVQNVLASGEIEKNFGCQINPKTTEIFLCGNPLMVDQVVEHFEALGFTRNTPNTPGNLHFDKH